MLLFFVFLSIFLLFFILYIVATNKYWYNMDDFYGFMSILTGICLLVNVVCIAVGPGSTRSHIRKFETIKQTIAEQRVDSISPLERVELIKSIMEENTWLKEEQFNCQSPWYNWYSDKAVLNLKPLK